MKIICPNCSTKFAIGLKTLGPKGRKLKCSSCAHVWRETDENVAAQNDAAQAEPSPTPKPTPAPKPVAAKAPEPAPQEEEQSQSAIDDLFDSPAPAEENDQGAIDDLFDSPAPAEENDQGAIDDLFDSPAASEENDQGAIDDLFDSPAASEENDQGAIDDLFDSPAASEENDQGAIDDLFDSPAASEENDQGAIDDLFDSPVAEENDQGAIDDLFDSPAAEENDQGAIDDMFDSPAASEDNDQGAIDDMFDTPVASGMSDDELRAPPPQSSEEFEKALPSQSKIYKKQSAGSSKKEMFKWGYLAVAASLIIGVFIFGKDMILSTFPKSEAAYRLYGMETNIVGLDFEKTTASHQSVDGVDYLQVKGSIVNNSDMTRPIPDVRGVLIDQFGNDIYSWQIKLSKSSLASGEISSFTDLLKNPNAQAKQVKFKFVLDNKLAEK